MGSVNIFSQSVTCPFTPLKVAFKEIFLIDTVQFIFFFFYKSCFWCYTLKIFTKPKLFSSKNFIDLDLTFRSMINFELTFIYKLWNKVWI